MEELFKVIEDLQQHDVLEFVDRVREWESMASQVAAIENFLRLNQETSSASAEGNFRDMVRDLRAELTDVKAHIRVLNRVIGNQGDPNQGDPEYGRM